MINQLNQIINIFNQTILAYLMIQISLNFLSCCEVTVKIQFFLQKFIKRDIRLKTVEKKASDKSQLLVFAQILQLDIIIDMDQACKKKIAAARKLIQQKNYAQAKQDLQILSYKYSKVYQIYLMLGLCFFKLDKLEEAEKQYHYVLDLMPNQPNALSQLCQIYTKRGNYQQGTKYMELNVQLLKKSDIKKYRQAIPKLVDLYEKDLNMEKIDKLFQSYCETEETIGQDFSYLARAYFKVGTTNQCFFLQKFEVMGMKGEQLRRVVPAAKEAMNRLLIQIVDYMRAIALAYQLSKKDIADSIMQLNLYFPDCTNVLMLLLFDEYCVGQMSYSSHILGQLYLLFQAHFDQVDNSYLNMRYTQPEVFAVCMMLAKEYLSFFKQFFSLDPVFQKYYPQLALIQGQLQGVAIRQQYRKKIDKFILKECRWLSQQSKHLNIQGLLENMKYRIQQLQNSYLQQVIAKIALHSFNNYNQLNDMKYKLKVRIKNLQPQAISPHLYKYYYDYVLKMAKIYKSLDQEIPISEVLEYITTHEPTDFKYQLQLIWFNFSMQLKAKQEAKEQLAKSCIKQISQILPKLEPSNQSQAYRRLLVLKIAAGISDLSGEIQSALKIERNFQNLQCAAFFYFWQQKLTEALAYLRQAYKLYQGHYHTNRLFFLTLYRCGHLKQALAFLEHLYPNFVSVFWVNYFLGINKINHKQFLQAQKYINKALQAFQAGSVDNFRFGYQKVYDIGPFTLLSLIQQNQYCIFYDQIVFPEQFIYNLLPSLSNIYFSREVENSRIKLYLKEGELLKILGRTKSSLNYLQDAYSQSFNIPVSQQSNTKLILDHILVRKQYATLLFYSSREREAYDMLIEANDLVKWQLSREESALSLKLDNEIQALFFEISISRLTTMMHFQSYESITQYLKQFKQRITKPKYPSLTFLKNKYQYHILDFMHTRGQLNQVQESLVDFLNHFGLDFYSRMNESFIVKLLELDQPQRKFVRQCIQDYYIVRGLSTPPNQQQLLQIFSIFPRSSTLCVLYGSVTKNLKQQTAAFLKVIQLDKESTISMDILASLYLKQKNYLAAAKLFLKSLQKDVLNTKCYLGLAICLFCLILRAVQLHQSQQVEIVRQCLVRINSYMQFIRINDPSEQYHILNFLKLLLNDEDHTNFQTRFVLQSVRSHSVFYKGSLIDQLYKVANKHTQTNNFWKGQSQMSIIQSYLQSTLKQISKQHKETVLLLINQAKKALSQVQKAKGSIGPQISFKYFQKLLHQIAIIINMAIKIDKFDIQIIKKVFELLRNWESNFALWGFAQNLLIQLKKKIKGYLYQLVLLGKWDANLIKEVSQLFLNANSYTYLVSHNKQIPNLHKQISKNLFLNPGNEQIRRIHAGFLIIKKGYFARRANLSYQLQLINNNNINTTEDMQTYKRLLFLHQDLNALLLYLQRQWSISGARSEQNVKKWVKLTDFSQKRLKAQQQLKSAQKAMRLKLQMQAYLSTQFNVELNPSFDSYQKGKLAKLIVSFKIMQKIDKKQQIKKQLYELVPLFKAQSDEFDWWILLSLVTYLVQRVELPEKFYHVIQVLEQSASDNSVKAFATLFKFLLIIRRDPRNQEDLVQQIIKLTQLCGACEGLVSPTTQVIVQCTRCLLLSSWDEIQVELSRISENSKISSYSDQILINFFEVLKQYKFAQSNPNGEGVVQMLILLVDSFLTIIKEPQLQGFILSLKAYILGLGQEFLPREMKMAMLYSPASAKRLLSK